MKPDTFPYLPHEVYADEVSKGADPIIGLTPGSRYINRVSRTKHTQNKDSVIQKYTQYNNAQPDEVTLLREKLFIFVLDF